MHKTSPAVQKPARIAHPVPGSAKAKPAVLATHKGVLLTMEHDGDSKGNGDGREAEYEQY
jgi:hypothetical protein